MQIYSNRSRSDLNIRWIKSPLRKFNLFTWYHDKDFVAKAAVSNRNDRTKVSNRFGPLLSNINKFICVCQMKVKSLAPSNLAIDTEKLTLYQLNEQLKYAMKTLYFFKDRVLPIKKFKFVKFLLRAVIYFMSQTRKHVLFCIIIA